MITKSASCFILAVLTVCQPIAQAGEENDVGGERNSFVGETDTKKYGCTSKSTYETDQAPGKKFCFASGNKKVENVWKASMRKRPFTIQVKMI